MDKKPNYYKLFHFPNFAESFSAYKPENEVGHCLYNYTDELTASTGGIYDFKV